jgi:O-acetyl-ADP-ribose deacetylase (regulator of RNase III)
MSSTAIRKQVAPKLLFQHTVTPSEKATPTRSVEVWMSACIVTNFGYKSLQHSQFPDNDSLPRAEKKQTWMLINPCNPGLTGCRQFPYFPRGGPVPETTVSNSFHRDWQPLGYVSQWGGMEVGHGMLYSTSVVDGLVHLHGGTLLQSELENLKQKDATSSWWNRLTSRRKEAADACPVGAAVQTSSGNSTLSKCYFAIIHTAPPFYTYNDHPEQSAETLLLSCYENSLKLAFPEVKDYATRIAAVPVLGSGCRGFPMDIASHIAADSILDWLFKDKPNDNDDRIRRTKNATNNANRRSTHLTGSSYTFKSHLDSSSTIHSIATNGRSATQDQLVAFCVREIIVAEQLADAIAQRIGGRWGS